MKRIIITIMALLSAVISVADMQASTRKERQLVSKGNKLYTERKFVEAASAYSEALKENPNSASAQYNLGLATMRQVTNPSDTTPAAKAKLQAAAKSFESVALRAKDKPGIAAKANYNLGNMAFNTKDYAGAVQHYKQALRIDPDDNNARHNLRIAQKQLQNQNKDKNKNQNQDQDKKNQDKEKDKQNQPQPQDRNKEQQSQQPKEQQINQQTAERILQAVENKENQTRARVNRASRGVRAGQTGAAQKRW